MPLGGKDDLRDLAQYAFEGRNEAEVRGDWIEPLLRLLGYGLGTRHRVLREQQVQLPDPVRMIGSKRIEIDFVPTVFGDRMWIMEAKRPQEGSDLFSPEHLGQAWSYATDPRISVPLMMICDGTRLGVFDLTRSDWDTPVFDHPKESLPEKFEELFDLLGASRVADRLRRDQLKHLRSALLAQVAEEPLDRTLNDVRELVAEARPIVRRRREEIYREIRSRIEEAGTPAIDAAGIWGLAGHLNGPLWTTLSDIDHAVRLIRRLPPEQRSREFGNFERACTIGAGEAHRMWFWLSIVRMGCATLLSGDEGCGDYFRKVADRSAHAHATSFEDDPLQSASYELQRGLGPLGWRIAANAKPAIDEAAANVAKSIEAEEWLRLDAEFGIDGLAAYKFQALFGPRAMLATLEPWETSAIQAAAGTVKELLAVLPKPPGMDGMLPVGDPWQESWLRGDPLRESSAATLQALIERADSPQSVALATHLIDQYFA